MKNGTVTEHIVSDKPLTNGHKNGAALHDCNGVEEYWDASMIDVSSIDYYSQEGLEKLRREYDTEYRTLSAHKDELLRTAYGQYVIIQGTHYEVHPTIDDSERRAHEIFKKGLFLRTKIDEIEMNECLAA